MSAGQLLVLVLTMAFSVGTADADPAFARAALSGRGAAVVDSGDTLEAILAEAGIAASDRTEAALALAGMFDVTELGPGHRAAWTVQGGDAERAGGLTLSVADGVEIALTFADTVAVTCAPEITTRDRCEVVTLNGALHDALPAKDAPERFAVDLAALFAAQVGFRRDLKGGEAFARV